ncbi:MAG TPA: hypothetical protein VGB28_03030 [Actinomycetota bacterium]|jgi:hypothetical protein
MKRTLALALSASLALPLLSAPASALPPSFDCGPDDGREQLTPDGSTYQFSAPVPASVGSDFGEAVYPPAGRRHAGAWFYVRANLVPFQYGDVLATLDWAGDGDFDLYVYDGQGNEVDNSVAFNPLDGNGEAVEAIGIEHCADLAFEVKNYAGQKDEPLTLRITFANPGPRFLCVEEDPHPACAGKLEGESPDPVADARTRLYLGGDRPGQLAMAGHYRPVGDTGLEAPLVSTLSPQRPTGGETNSFTKTAAGNQDQYQNPFMANYQMALSKPLEIKGDVTAELFVSSQTFPDGGGPLFVDLWVDGEYPEGTRLGRIAVPGSAIGTNPTRVVATFTGLDAVAESELLLQISSEPVATSAGVVGDPKDAEWTIYYDSVQFPARLTMDLPEGALG